MSPYKLEGGPQYELFLIVGVILATIWLRNLLVPLLFGFADFTNSKTKLWLKFLLDFVVVLWPPLLSMTLAEGHLIQMISVLYFAVFLLWVFAMCINCKSEKRADWKEIFNAEVPDDFGVTTNVNYFRGVMLVLIAIAILAVDFNVFPSRFSKTSGYGHSVMDIGVAACVIGDGLGSRMSRALNSERRQKRLGSRSFFLSGKFILPLLGFLRTFVLSLIGYHKSETEYGRHWNFFFTLGVVVIVTRSLSRDRPITFCISFAAVSELILRNGFEHRVLFEKNKRENIIMANIEGLVSLPGYISLFYASYAVADWIANTTMKERTIRAWWRASFKLILLAAVFFATQKIFELFLALPSRRVANVTYSLSQLSLLIAGFGVATMIQTLTIALWMAEVLRFSGGDHPFRSLEPCIMETVNSQGLWFFLLANILTGAFGMSMKTHLVGRHLAFCYLTGYLLTCCVFAQLLQLMLKKHRKSGELPQVSTSEKLIGNGSTTSDIEKFHSTDI